MIKVSSLEKYEIKIDAKDEISQAFGQKVVTEFARRDMLMLYDLSLVDICVTVGNDIGYDNTEIEQIHVCDVIPSVWTYWKPSMQWLVQQELSGYKDETDYFGEAVPVAIPTETPEEKEALDAIEKKSPHDVGAHVSNASKPVYTQAMCDAGELPPVGSAFISAFISAIIDDILMTCLYSSKFCVIGGFGDMEVVFNLHNGIDYEFRPIKTEREKAIDNAFEALVFNGDVDMSDAQSVIGKLYDAGYLK